MKARITRVVDADTLHVTLLDGPIPIGLNSRLYTETNEIVRLLGLDAYKKGTEKGDAGIEYMSTIGNIDLMANGRDKYGRVLSVIFDGVINVNAELVVRGLAVSWDGHGPRPAGLKEKGS